jgi:hypothetical protein
LITWTVDFLTEEPWCQINVNGDEFVHRFTNLRGHYQQYIFGAVMAIEHELILIPDSSILNSLPPPVVPSYSNVTNSGEEKLSETSAAPGSLRECTRYSTRLSTWVLGNGVAPQSKSSIATTSALFPRAHRRQASKNETVRTCCVALRVCRSLLALSIILSRAGNKDLENEVVSRLVVVSGERLTVTTDVDYPLGHLFIEWMVRSNIFTKILQLSFLCPSSLLRLIGSKLLYFAVPLLPPSVVARSFSESGLLVRHVGQTEHMKGHQQTPDGRLFEAMMMKLGEHLNPYWIHPHFTTQVKPGVGLAIPVLSLSNLIKQLYLLLRSVCCSPIVRWRNEVRDSIQRVLPVANGSVSALKNLLAAAADFDGCSFQLENRRDPGINAALGLLSISGGWQSGLGLSYGAVVRHLGAGTSMPEPHIIVGYGNTGVFGESLLVVPLISMNDEQPKKTNDVSSGLETVFTFFLQGEQLKSTVPSAVLSCCRSPAIQAVLVELLLTAVSINTSDARQKLRIERAETDTRLTAAVVVTDSVEIKPSLNEGFEVSMPGASFLQISFERSSSVDADEGSSSDNSYFVVFKDEERKDFWGSPRYDLTEILQKPTSVRVDSDRCYVLFCAETAEITRYVVSLIVVTDVY